MPNRIIKESICSSESIDGLTWFEECFFYRLIVNCDDYGRMDARPSILKARLFPLRSITNRQIEAALKSLRTAGIVELYTVDAHPFLQLRTWERHQQIRAKRSKYPQPLDCQFKPGDKSMISSDIICNQMQSNVPVIQSNPIQSESKSESESESNARTREEELPLLSPVIISWEQAKGRVITDAEKQQISNLCTAYGESKLLYAIEQAVLNDAVKLAYIKAVASGDGKPQKAKAGKQPIGDDYSEVYK